MDGYAHFNNFLRKTNSYIFMHGHVLPYETGLDHMKETLQDPSTYDLLYTYAYPEKKLISYDCMPNTGQAPLVSKLVMKLLEKFCPNDFQAFPVVIQNENPRLSDFENHDYRLLNITNTVDSFDKDKTEFNYSSEKLGGHIYGVKRHLNLKENAMGTHHLARDATLHSYVLVSPELVALFEKEKITGVRFLKDEEAYS